MKESKVFLLCAMVLALLSFFTETEVNAACAASDPSCGQFGKNSIQFVGTAPAFCNLAKGNNLPCTRYDYQYSGSAAATQIELLIPKEVQSGWTSADASVAGCAFLLTDGQGDPINGFGVKILTHNTCQLGAVPNNTAFSIFADPSVAQPLSWQAVYTKSNIAADLLNGPAELQTAVAETGATLTTSEGVSITYTNVGGQITITGGSAALIPINQTKFCIPTPNGGTPTFTNANGSWTCETITFATEQCDIKTAGTDPCRFIGNTCVSY